MASGSTAPFSGEFVDLENVPKLPEGISAEQILENNSDVVRQVAEARHAAGLSQSNADGGFFDAFVDRTKLAASSSIKFSKNTPKLASAGGFDISNADFTNKISGRGSRPHGIAFNNDGTKLFQAETFDNFIHEFSLSTPFDISSASFTQSVSTQDTTPTGLAFNNDGTRMFEVGANDGTISTFDLNTAFDLSTAEFIGSVKGAKDGEPEDLAFNNDGTKMYEVGSSGDKIYEFSLSTAFSVTSASFTQSINTQDSKPEDLVFNNDGTKMYEIGSNGDKIYELSLSTPFDISTAIFTRSINTQGGSPTGLAFNSDGTRMFEIGSSTQEIYQYDVTSGFVSNGKVTNQKFTFTDTQGNAFSPSKVGIFPEQTLNGQSITYDLKDSSGNIVKTFNQSDLNQLVDVSTTDTNFQVEANLSGDGSQTPELEFLDVRGV